MNYKCLKTNIFEKEGYKIVPIRSDDRYDIMNWRNEQIYHLRQDKPLTKKDQDYYFNNVISDLFNQEKPNQLLFSFLKNDVCIGYGGLVHINWVDKNAEISFIMDTELEKDYFSKYWTIILHLIGQVAFKELNLYKLYTYAIDLRPQIYEIIENSGFVKEAILKNHCFFNGKYLNVVIHSKFNKSKDL